MTSTTRARFPSLTYTTAASAREASDMNE